MNNHPNWQLLVQLSNHAQAEALRGLLDAAGIPTLLSQEGAGRAYGLTVGSLGVVEVLVSDAYRAEAQEILDAYFAGEYEEPGEEDDESEA
ncbi:MAG TPA: DUF2007 domain-containing protein [Anaerolineales bacterium]|nr:DUF2007 domain-containing protein [Anaerolineales bacterium]